MALGRSGYTNSTIYVVVGGTYIGGGLNGYSGGSAYAFEVRERSPELDMPRQDTTTGPYKTGVPGPASERIRIVGFFKGLNIPPIGMYSDTYIKLDMTVAFRRQCILQRTQFREVGTIDQAIGFEITGETDDVFVVALGGVIA